MILPTKRINENRALLPIGAEILKRLTEPKTISRLWDELKKERVSRQTPSSLTYDWFILALDLLYILDTVELDKGRIVKLIK